MREGDLVSCEGPVVDDVFEDEHRRCAHGLRLEEVVCCEDEMGVKKRGERVAYAVEQRFLTALLPVSELSRANVNGCSDFTEQRGIGRACLFSIFDYFWEVLNNDTEMWIISS